MEIRVNTMEPDAILKMDMEKFKEHMTESFHLEDSVKCALSVEKNKTPHKDKHVVQLAYLCIDWGQVLKMWHEKPQDEMRIYFLKTAIEDMKVYRPRDTVVGTGVFTFDEINHTNQEYLIVHTNTPLFELHVERMLQNIVLDYGDHTWDKIPPFERFGK